MERGAVTRDGEVHGADEGIALEGARGVLVVRGPILGAADTKVRDPHGGRLSRIPERRVDSRTGNAPGHGELPTDRRWRGGMERGCRTWGGPGSRPKGCAWR